MPKFILCVFIGLFFTVMTLFASAAESVPIKDFELRVKRHWVSSDGNITLDIYTGTWKSHGLMQMTDTRYVSSFEGLQKGTQFDLKTYDAERGLEAPPLYTIRGTLDLNRNTFTADIIDMETGVTNRVNFAPYYPIKNRPTLNFKFWGFEDADWHRTHVTRIQVVDKATAKVIQTLSGFDAMPLGTAYYEDINFDGYFDLRMSLDASSTSANEKYLYWLYDPVTKRFERSAQFEEQPGFLDTSFWCKELRFYGPNNFNYINGKMVPARDTYCRPWD